ncbi:hypothetical protein FSP39_000310 [Pinctada imbricata]|uniref:Uncharacterized protein n=1 Tax=Pinctada imbricata TaxID=66713 RepID=A0AA88YA20_PINIB|nr:hypothetical protein FSP39_000310 [Pinctada imbricata]
MCLINFVCTFNVDLKNPLIFRGTLDSHFGTATEMLESQGSKWLLVGAPRDNFTDIPDLVRPGNVYRCPIQAAGSNPRTNCQPIRIRSAENTNPSPVSGIYEQTEQNLGSSILVGSQAVVICAPLWKNLRDYPTNRYYNPVGHCYELPHSDLTNVKSKFFRIGRNEWQIRDSGGATVQLYASALLGFSLTTSPVCAPLWKDLRRYSSAQSYLAYGACHELDKSNLESVTPKYFDIDNADLFRFGTNFMATAIFGFSLARTNDSTYSVILGSPNTVNARGYAVASGRFGSGLTPMPQVVVGSPGYTSSNGPVGAVCRIE